MVWNEDILPVHHMYPPCGTSVWRMLPSIHISTSALLSPQMNHSFHTLLNTLYTGFVSSFDALDS